MSESNMLKRLLKKAAGAAQRKAARKKLPVAISENGEIKLIYPDKSEKVLYKSRRTKKRA